MSKITKYGKKLLFPFVTLLLLFSLNLNSFAATSNTVLFVEADNLCTYYTSSGNEVNCTSTTSIKAVNYSIEGSSYPGTTFTFPAAATNLQKVILSNADLDIYTNTKYKYDFYVKLGSTSGSTGVVSINIFYYVDGEFKQVTTLYQNENLSTNTWSRVSGSFQTPDLSGNVTCSVMFTFSAKESSGRYLYLSDAVFTLDDPLINGDPIGTPSTDELNGTLDEYEDVMSGLPEVDSDKLDELMKFDFDSFTAGMSFCRDMFERLMATFGFSSVLTFALAIGLATYVIGRKVG